MSKFSGKCDIYDWFGMIACNPDETPFDCFKRRKAKLLLDYDSDNPVSIDKPSDLVPFYPFVSAAMASSESGDVIILSRDYISELTGIISSRSVMEHRRTLLKEYDRVVKEEDPKYVQTC